MNRISRDGFLIGISALLLLAAYGCAWAQKPGGADANGVMSAKDILRQLTPPIPSRGLGRRGAVVEQAAVSLSIPFDSNSSRLQPTAAKQLHNLVIALNSDDLKPFRFEISGHTDASGNAAYNKRLSTRRAIAVKEFLVHAGVGANRIDTAGYGSERPLKPDAPLDAANRRVEIRNLGEDTAAAGQ
jgi:outer membrane protein OmpA-like peptidoglycan-associated protein